jgi:hypothetical protein
MSALIGREGISKLFSYALPPAACGARYLLLGPRASLPAMSALARNIEDALALKILHPTQRTI